MAGGIILRAPPVAGPVAHGFCPAVRTETVRETIGYFDTFGMLLRPYHVRGLFRRRCRTPPPRRVHRSFARSLRNRAADREDSKSADLGAFLFVMAGPTVCAGGTFRWAGETIGPGCDLVRQNKSRMSCCPISPLAASVRARECQEVQRHAYGRLCANFLVLVVALCARSIYDDSPLADLCGSIGGNVWCLAT